MYIKGLIKLFISFCLYFLLSYNNNYETFAAHIDTKDKCI